MVLAFITASVATGLILLAVLGAPALLTGYLAFMLASVAVLAAITLVWKISIHCAVAAGSVTILALVYGPLVLGGYLLVGLLGWSRVAVRDHTVLQVSAAASSARRRLSSPTRPSCVRPGQGGGQVAGAAEQPGYGDRVHVVVIADDLAVAHPDHAEGGMPVGLPGRLRPAVVGDLGDHDLGVVGLADHEPRRPP